MKENIVNKDLFEEWEQKIQQAEGELNQSREKLNATINTTRFSDIKGMINGLAEQLVVAKQKAQEHLFERTGDILKDVQRDLPVLKDRIDDAMKEAAERRAAEPENATNTTQIESNITNTTNTTG